MSRYYLIAISLLFPPYFLSANIILYLSAAFATVTMERVLNNKPVLDIQNLISKRMTEYLPQLKEMVCLVESLLKNVRISSNGFL